MFFSFNDTVLLRNILADCRMRRQREWGVMAAVGCGLTTAAMAGGCGLACFYLHTSCVRCPPSKKSCQWVVKDFAYVEYVETWYKNLHVLHCSQRDPFHTKHSLRVGWRNLVCVSPIFAIIVSFMLFTVFPLVYVLYFEEFLIHDSRGLMILKKIWPNLLGLCHFPLNT